jgi:hypothetical protein
LRRFSGSPGTGLGRNQLVAEPWPPNPVMRRSILLMHMLSHLVW